MNEVKMQEMAVKIAAEIARAHADTEKEQRVLAKALPPWIFAVMAEVRAATVEEIATVIERADPPQSAAEAPRCFAGAIRSTFGKL